MKGMKNDLITLAIETSCDETACAVVKNGEEILSNVIHTQIEGIELEIKDLQKDGKSHTHKIKKLQKKIEKLNEKSSQIKGAKDSLNDLAKDMKKNTKFSVNRLRQIRHDLKKYLYNSQR